MLTAAQTARDDLTQRFAAWRARQGLRTDALAAEARVATLGVLVDKATEAVTFMSKRQLESVCVKLQAHLAAGWEVAIQDEPFRIGILQGGRRLSASGAQRNGLLLAMASAVPIADDENVLLLPPERAYDGATFVALMEALTGSAAQIILTNTEPPPRLPEGWTIYAPTRDGVPTLVMPTAPAEKKPRKPRKPKEAAPVVEADEERAAQLAAEMGAAVRDALGSVFGGFE